MRRVLRGGLCPQGSGAGRGERDAPRAPELRGLQPHLATNWGPTTILRSTSDVAKLKETEGGPLIIHGSATLNRSLSDAGLIDRYHLLVFPVLLGAGKRLFSDTDKDAQRLRLLASESYRNGVQKLVYEVVR
jgi:dihydrofolate reductase